MLKKLVVLNRDIKLKNFEKSFRRAGKIAKQICVSQRLDFAQNRFGFRPIDTPENEIL